MQLPDGFTVFDARGAWYSPRAGRTIHQDSKVLTVAAPATDAARAAVHLNNDLGIGNGLSLVVVHDTLHHARGLREGGNDGEQGSDERDGKEPRTVDYYRRNLLKDWPLTAVDNIGEKE